MIERVVRPNGIALALPWSVYQHILHSVCPDHHDDAGTTLLSLKTVVKGVAGRRILIKCVWALALSLTKHATVECRRCTTSVLKLLAVCGVLVAATAGA